MHINVTIANDPPLTMSWAEFVAVNADGIDADELADIESTVRGGKSYHGGGGAAVAFTITMAEG